MYVILERNDWAFGTLGCDYVAAHNGDIIVSDMCKRDVESVCKRASIDENFANMLEACAQRMGRALSTDECDAIAKHLA